ncbi:hypothetical protein F2Q68_00015753 [Brassica cretica]|uniref:Secreted protein n=2 Tax=Brassica cretica TaxID=69181 RepID=A0ABQ7F5Y4_BRACR|nr:hypothetical protein F2Q68_00015753 [Brassica cretica]KAF3611363.1 hypothetical protein DY000_02048332 [Brassica cretica]
MPSSQLASLCTLELLVISIASVTSRSRTGGNEPTVGEASGSVGGLAVKHGGHNTNPERRSRPANSRNELHQKQQDHRYKNSSSVVRATHSYRTNRGDQSKSTRFNPYARGKDRHLQIREDKPYMRHQHDHESAPQWRKNEKEMEKAVIKAPSLDEREAFEQKDSETSVEPGQNDGRRIK